MVKVIKEFIQGKHPDQALCEDTYFISEDYVAVIDGVSSKSNFHYHGKTTGQLASQIIKEALGQLSKEALLEEILATINAAINNFYQDVTFDLDRGEYGLQAVMALYSHYLGKIFLVGDCQARVNGKNYYQPKLSDEVLSQMRSLVLAIEADQGGDQAQDPGREVILPWIIQATCFANQDDTPYGYAVINGESIPASLIQVIPVQAGDQVTLTSDGYPEIKEDFTATESYLEAILTKDPQLSRDFLSTKGLNPRDNSFDDRCYVEFIVT
ncbi:MULTISPECIES: hypothetical protein [Aerococcus]|uniref:hypothetical protein n=1 Tax=Aerococcus TaxID=1375 RepID=UPI000DCC25EB|nr:MULTISPECIES: hypothetical protein [Aerococcus]KAA9296318.1 hypothetical protein F6I08_08710 [Aerococcus tenax]MDK6688915.1 hypothetical protein [Aerococcus urinae]MDK8133790.1 hypothetical protein [Aerococcus urinae]MDK8485532.1 hypothetical protein [Aerococcus urinae]MDL5179061.1 hypothetical protein [Aerococcus tenax]